MNERKLNDTELEEVIGELLQDERLAHPQRFLSFVRGRLGAEVCYLVLDIGTEQENTVHPGFAVTRAGGVNTLAWHTVEANSSRFDVKMRPGVVNHFSGDILDWLWPWMDEEPEFRHLSHRIVSLATIGLFHERTLIGVLCAGFTRERTIMSDQERLLRRLSLFLQVAVDRADLIRELEETKKNLAKG